MAQFGEPQFWTNANTDRNINIAMINANTAVGGIWIWYDVFSPPTQQKETEEAKPKMRGVFEIMVVDPETDEISVYRRVANDERMAQLKVVATEPKLAEHAEDYDWIIRRLGDVRCKKPKPQEVKVVP